MLFSQNNIEPNFIMQSSSTMQPPSTVVELGERKHVSEMEIGDESRTSSEECVPPTSVGLNMMVALVSKSMRYSHAFSQDSRTAERRHAWLTGPSQWFTGLSAGAGIATFVAMLLTTLSAEIQLAMYGVFAAFSSVAFVMKREDIKRDYGTQAALFLSAHRGFQAFAARHRLMCFCKRELPYNFDLYMERAQQEMQAMEGDAPRLLTARATLFLEKRETQLPPTLQDEIHNLRLAAAEIARKSAEFEQVYRERGRGSMGTGEDVPRGIGGANIILGAVPSLGLTPHRVHNEEAGGIRRFLANMIAGR